MSVHRPWASENYAELCSALRRRLGCNVEHVSDNVLEKNLNAVRMEEQTLLYTS
jgi:hypothetical protein